MGKFLDDLGTFENYVAPWETKAGGDTEVDKARLKRHLYNLEKDKATAQDARDEAAEKVTVLEKDLDEARKDKDGAKIARLEKDLEAANKDLATSKSDYLRLEVAVEKGLDPKQAKRLQGETKEDLEADADDLLESFGVKKEAENDGGDDEDDEEIDQSAVRRGPARVSNPGDPKGGDSSGDLTDAQIAKLVAAGEFD